MGLALAAHDQLTPALEEARRAAALDPRSAEAQVALGVILRLERRIDDSLVACHRAAEIDPGSPRVLVALAESLREAERYSEAIEMYGQAIDLDHEAIVPQLGAAATWQKGGNLETARRLYGLLLDKWDYAKNRVRLGLASLFVASEDYEGAISQYGQIEIPDDASMPAVLALYGKGYSLLRLGRDAEAEYFLSTLVDRVPPDYDGPARGREFLFRAYEDLVDYFGKRGRERKVESLLRAASERPRAPTRLARRLAGLLGSKGKTDEAGAVLEGAILRSDPLEDPLELTETAVALARVRTAGGKHRLDAGSAAAGALKLCDERIQASPLGVAHFRLARAQALARDTAAAIASLRLARKSGYLPVDALDAESDFDSVRKDPDFQALLH